MKTQQQQQYTPDSMEVALVSEQELEKQYEEMLDDCYGEVNICGMKYDASRALKDVDPIVFQCGFSDYISAELDETIIEIDGEYYRVDLLEEID